MKVVIAMVFSTFKLDLPECSDHIRWEMAVVASPRVHGSKGGAHELPIKLSVLAK